MSVLPAVALLSRDEARSLTDEVKGDAERLWRKLVELYDGGAHLALGYSSWGAYFKTEFGASERHGYRLLDAGRALELVSDQLVTPVNEAQARELVPLLDEPEKLREAWAEASSDGEPTAPKVREAVREVGPAVMQAPRPDLRVAAREVIAKARLVGRHYEVPMRTMAALMLAAGERK